MSAINRSALVALLNAKILSGTNQTSAANIREQQNAIIESLVALIDDKDVAEGYLGISLAGLVDVSFIKQAVPTGLFLKDDGTWAAALSASLNSGRILVGSAGNVATSVAMSGGATILPTGVVTLNNAAVIAKLLTAYVSGAGVIDATDSILSAIQKLDGNNNVLAKFNSFSDAGNATTSETDLVTNTIAASQLVSNGDKLESEYGGVFVSSGTATRQIRIYFGGTLIFDTGTLTLSLSSAWTAYCTVIRVSASVVRYMISFATQGAALSAYTSVGEVTGLTLSVTNILKITGQAAGVGAATNDIVLKMSMVNYMKTA